MTQNQDNYSCIKTIEHTFDIALPPKYICNEEKAIVKILNSWKYKYNQELKGVMLYYDDLKFIGDLGRIIEDQPFIYWKIKGKFSTFNTSVGNIIKGKINRFGRGYIGCTIADCISATIHLPKETDQDLSAYLKIDQDILFQVDKIDLDKAYIEGSITEQCISLIKETIDLVNYDAESLNGTFS